MIRRLFSGALVIVAMVAATVAGGWAARAVLCPRGGGAATQRGKPVTVLPFRERDFGAVCGGTLLTARFPVENAGNRRLLLREQSTPCCGDPAEPRRMILEPGECDELVVQVDTNQWAGQLEHEVPYRTNDPDLPRFVLRVRGVIHSSARGAASYDEVSPGR